MRQFKYYLGSGDPMGENNPNEVFNDIYVTRLIELGIPEDKMEEVASMFENIYGMGYENGYSSAIFDSDESA